MIEALDEQIGVNVFQLFREQNIMVIANYNADVAEYWEWSGEGFLPVDTSNEAYKLGVNYMIYGLTH